MTKATIIQTNFTAGELPPRAYGRVDIARYNNGAKRLRNVFPLVHGGALRRWGLRYITAAKNPDKRCRLIPFVFDRQNSYVLEFGDSYMRVFTPSGQVQSGGDPFEIATPYTDAMIGSLNYAQRADTMFLANEDEPLNSLRRYADDNWILGETPLVVYPSDEINERPAVGLTLSTVSVGSPRTIALGAPYWLASDVGRDVWASQGIATITSVTSSTVAVGSISVAFSGSSFSSGDWQLTGSPQCYLHSTAKEPTGATVTLYAGRASRNAKLTLTAVSGDSVTATASSNVFVVGDVGKYIMTADTGLAVITAFTDAQTVTVDIDASFYGKKYVSGTWAITADAFRSSDVGKYVRMNGGAIKINTVTSASEVVGEILIPMNASVSAPPGAWTLESSIWNPYDGYPRAVNIHEQRLFAGGSPGFPQRFSASVIGEYLNFTLGTDDDQGLSYDVSTDEQNAIEHMAIGDTLFVLTSGAEIPVFGGTEKPITPTNLQAKVKSSIGSGDVRPVRIGSELCIVNRAKTKLFGLSWDIGNLSYATSELSKLGRHLTEIGIVEIAFQREPEQLLWLVLADGTMATLTLDREEEVIAWAPHYTDGEFESVCVIPTETSEQVFVSVKRVVDGQDVRYIERFEDGLHTDSAVTGSELVATDVWSGFDHLEGCTLDVKADGVHQGLIEVVSGDITLTRTANTIEAGLHYQSLVEPLPPELPDATGSSTADQISVNEVTLCVLDTIGCSVNGDYIAFTQTDELSLDEPPAALTGDVYTTKLGWQRGADALVITQDQPYPFHLLAVIRSVTSNG